MVENSIYEIPDPNFYANAAFVKNEFAYVAAGNREIIALSMRGHYEPRRKAVLPKDPLGITVDDGVVYGFGNFRDVGERTVVRTRALDGTPSSVLDFEKGLLNWIEPLRFALRTTDASGGEWLSRKEIGGYGVYRAEAGDLTWTPKPTYKFFFAHGTYSVEVTADNVIRTSYLGATESTAAGQWPAKFPDRSWIEVVDGTYTDYLLYVPTAGLVLKASDEDYSILAILPFSLGNPSPTNSHEHICNFENSEEEGGMSRTTIRGEYEYENFSVLWCSRLVDPYKPGNRRADDFGSWHQVCSGSNCVTTAMVDSGTVGVLPIGKDRWLSLVDDRIAYTTSIIEWVPMISADFVVETGQNFGVPNPDYRSAEVHRRVFLGRPEGWSLQSDGTVRVWMTDGSAFTYDPDARTVTNRIAPLDE